MSARRGIAAAAEKRDTGTDFTAETFERLADQMTKGRIPLPRVTVSDDIVAGLRVIIRNTGLISYHVQYQFGDSRPYLKIGDFPGMTVENARKVARTVKSLADKGIDVQDGLHQRLVRELLKEGDKWRP